MSAIGKETILTGLGRDWKLSRWDFTQWDKWVEWARKKFPDPVAAIRKEMQFYAYEDEVMKGDLRLANANPDRSAGEAAAKELTMRLAASNAIQTRLSKDAMEAAGKAISMASPKAFELLESPEGAGYLLYLLMIDNQPDATYAQAMMLIVELGVAEVQKKFDEAAGTPPIAKKNDSQQEPPTSTSP